MERYIAQDQREEMLSFFYERTNAHVARVEKNLYKISALGVFPETEFYRLATLHDSSKFHDPERIPYIYLTWSKKCKKDGIDFPLSNLMQESIHKATLHHVTTNRHHPEFWDKSGQDVVNPRDRDKPSGILVNATTMSLLYICEMVADWVAMSEELNNSPIQWADDNINIRWKFTDEQVEQIYRIIKGIWK